MRSNQSNMNLEVIFEFIFLTHLIRIISADNLGELFSYCHE